MSEENTKRERTEAQKAASRRNGAKSRGPITPMGKSISSRNATTHGLTSAQLLLPNEDPAQFEALRRDLMAEYRPKTTTEALLVDEMVQAKWRHYRATAIEVALVAGEMAVTQAALEKRFKRFSESFRSGYALESSIAKGHGSLPHILRCQARAHREFHKALQTLRALRPPRQAKSVETNPATPLIPQEVTPQQPDPEPKDLELKAMPPATRILATLALAATSVALAVKTPELWDTLSTRALAGRQTNGAFLVASEQLVRPWRLKSHIAGRPADLALDPTGGRFAAILNGNSLVTIDLASGAELSRVRTRTTSYLGIAFRPGKAELWASEATRDGPDAILRIAYTPDGRLLANSLERLALPGRHPIPAGLAFSKDGTTLYAALHHDNQIAVVDAVHFQVRQTWPSDLAPFALALSSDRLYVSNRAGARRSAATPVAPSGKQDLPTDAAGSVLEGNIQAFDLTTGKVAATYPAGRATAGISLHGNTLIAANAHSDSLTLIDTKSGETATLAIDGGSKALPGLLPNAVAFRADGKRLYVALGGDNSVAIFDGAGLRWKLAGKAPTGWFPTALRVDPTSGMLHIASVKGTGNDEQPQAKGHYKSTVYEGALSSIADPTPAQLAAGSREVAAAADPHFTPNGGVAELHKLGIEHVFFIIKENRTYDQVLSDLPKGNRDPSLLMYGRDVTPNHHALAEKYVLLDNFYSSGAISFEGHQWLMMGFVSDHVERALQAAPRGYAWNMGDSLTVSPAGFFWQTDSRSPISVRLLGPLSEPAQPGPDGLMRDINEAQMMSWSEHWDHYRKGTWRNVIGSRCVVPSLKPIFDERFPPSEMKVPDQIRAAAFAERLDAWTQAGTTPNLVIMTMTSDHTEGRNPRAPRPRSMVADNDWALGKVVEKISHSNIWDKSLILVVEDDAQDGVDHVSGRRTVALAIGPHIRREAVDSNYYTHISLVRTMQDIFRLTPRTRFLANSRAMNSIFETTARLDPYTAIEPGIRLDDMNPPATALKGRERWATEESAKMNWNDLDDVPTDVLNRILWWDAKGFDKEYPAASAVGSLR